MNVPVLIVDDNASKRTAMRAVLSPLGYTIVEATSGLEALRRVMAQDFAVILLDVRMPIMDGFETARLIRLRWQSEMTPIIFMTAYGSDDIANADRYTQGAVDFMFAPVQPDELRAKVSVFANLFQKAETLAARARAVQRSADQFRLLTDAAPIGIFQTDAHNNYSYTNPRWSEISGIAAHDAVGQHWDVILGAPDRADLAAEFSETDVGRAEFCHRFEIQSSGAEPRIVLMTSSAIPDNDGGTAGWVGTLADVTIEAGAEAAMSEARDQATAASILKSDFLANMSHEIRTPMNGVIGMTDLLLETNLDARQRDYAQTVRNSGEALLTIINDILDFSKVEAGKLEVEDIDFSACQVLDDVVDLLAGSARAKGLDLVTFVADSVAARLTGDPGRVRQVLTNLIGNAIKFTQTGEVVVRVIGVNDGDTPALIRFEVSDTGDGIAPGKLDMIFQPFAQADTSTSRRYGGTGLGLAISSHLVTLMGGECGVTSNLGVGSTFWFTISACARSEMGACEMRPGGEGLDGVRVLVVDDNASQRDVLSEYLTGWGMTADLADTAPAALAVLNDAASHGAPFAVVLVDRTMPGTDGLELIEALNADPSVGAAVVVVSELGHAPCLDAVPAIDGWSVLSKPVHRDDLYRSLRAALRLEPIDRVDPDVDTARPSVPSGVDVGRVLLAEDNLINQKVAVAILAGAGYRVDTALDGAAAVKAFAATRYDAVLMDCQMPELNGYEATEVMRTQEGDGRRTPIIALTAAARQEDRRRCIVSGMDAFLAKPVSKDALLATLRRVIAEQQVVFIPTAVADRQVENVVDSCAREDLRVSG